MVYEIKILPATLRALVVEPELRELVEGLASDPRPPGARRIRDTGRTQMWRLRAGSARIVYRIEGDTISVSRIIGQRQNWP